MVKISENKRYYWLKLKEDFFDNKRIKKLRKIAGGDTYTIIYLKLMLLSIKTGGKIEFEGVENSFAEEMALTLDESPENVAATLIFLQGCGLIESSDNITFFLPEAAECIGSETASAQRGKEYRKALTDEQKKQERERAKLGMRETRQRRKEQVTNSYEQVTNVEKEKEIEKDTREKIQDKREDIEVSTEQTSCSVPIIELPLNTGSYPVYEESVVTWAELYPNVDVMQQLRNMKGWLLANPKKRKTMNGIDRFINSWLSREQDKPSYNKGDDNGSNTTKKTNELPEIPF